MLTVIIQFNPIEGGIIMKKFFGTLLALFTVLCLSVCPAQAAWKGQSGGAGVSGQFGQITITLSTIEVDLVGEILVPGWTGTFAITVDNDGSIPVILSWESADKPEYLTIETSIDAVPLTLEADVGTVEVIVTLILAEDLSSDLQGEVMTFTMTFVGDQVVI